MAKFTGNASPRPRIHGTPTGRVWIRHFDDGMVRTIGAIPHPDPSIREYVLPIKNLPEANDFVPVLGKKNPEQTTMLDRFPRIVVNRDSWDPAKERLHPGAEEYRSPAGEPVTIQLPAEPLGTTLDGHTKYCSKEQASPFDITYTIEVWHRYENWVQPILFRILEAFKLQSLVRVTDNLGDVRTYNVFMDSGPADLSEVLSLTDRGIGYSVSYRVQGEIDLAGEDIYPSMRYPQIDLVPKDRVEGC